MSLTDILIESELIEDAYEYTRTRQNNINYVNQSTRNGEERMTDTAFGLNIDLPRKPSEDYLWNLFTSTHGLHEKPTFESNHICLTKYTCTECRLSVIVKDECFKSHVFVHSFCEDQVEYIHRTCLYEKRNGRNRSGQLSYTILKVEE